MAQSDKPNATNLAKVGPQTADPSDNPGAPGVYGPLRSFGRRRSRKLSPRQTELFYTGRHRFSLDLGSPPPADLGLLFDPPVREIWLEIGFGGGEHLLWQAAHNPDVGIIACEPFVDGVVKVMDGIASRDLRNILIHADDARDVLAWLPESSISRVFVLFPDPWPKKKHIKRRLVSQHLLEQFSRVMVPGGELRLATDIADYARGMLRAIRQQLAFRWQARSPSDWRERPTDWPGTRYEQKAIREGRLRYFLKFKLSR